MVHHVLRHIAEEKCFLLGKPCSATCLQNSFVEQFNKLTEESAFEHSFIRPGKASAFTPLPHPVQEARAFVDADLQVGVVQSRPFDTRKGGSFRINPDFRLVYEEAGAEGAGDTKDSLDVLGLRIESGLESV